MVHYGEKFGSGAACAEHWLGSDSIEMFDKADDFECWEGRNGHVTVIKDEDGRWALDRGSSVFEEPSKIEPPGFDNWYGEPSW